jgi:DNA-binding response OmpR family regulator
MLREATGVVLVVEHDVLRRHATATQLRRGGLEVFEAADATEAKMILERMAVDVLLSDVNLVDGEPLAQWVKEHDLPTRVCWLVSESDSQERRLHS